MTSIFTTELRLALALAMYAGLAHSVGKSWCGVINFPATTFAVVAKPPLGHFRSDAAFFPNYYGQTCSYY